MTTDGCATLPTSWRNFADKWNEPNERRLATLEPSPTHLHQPASGTTTSMVRRSGRAVLTPAQQALGLRRSITGCRCRIRRGLLTCIVNLPPTPASRRYTVKFTQQPPFVPDAEILAPALRLHPGAEGLPHVYPGDKLCLHQPGEWKSNMSIADTTLPWTSEWLYHYEIWIITGEWTGGGDWPGVHRS